MTIKHSLFTFLVASSLTLSGCIIHVGNSTARGGSDVSSVLGDINIDEYEQAGDLSTVNGTVYLAQHASAKDISIVNGSLELASHTRVDTVDIVNGDISARSHLQAVKLATVNGNIEIGETSIIEQHIESVNGNIVLESTTITGDVSSYNGDITLTGATRIEGDITYEQPNKRWFGEQEKTPKLTLGPNVVVLGNIVLERSVELNIENPALQNKVIKEFGRSDE